MRSIYGKDGWGRGALLKKIIIIIEYDMILEMREQEYERIIVRENGGMVGAVKEGKLGKNMRNLARKIRFFV